jgi:hypothetical protein
VSWYFVAPVDGLLGASLTAGGVGAAVEEGGSFESSLAKRRGVVAMERAVCF